MQWQVFIPVVLLAFSGSVAGIMTFHLWGKRRTPENVWLAILLAACATCCLIFSVIYAIQGSQIIVYTLIPYIISFVTLIFVITTEKIRSLEITPLARKQLVDTLVDPVLAIDLDSVLFDWNPAAQAIFGINPDQALGKPVTFILQGWDELAATIIHPPMMKTRIETVPGANGCWYDIQITPITNNRRQLTGWVIVLHDITRQKDAETQLSRLATVVEQAQEIIVITDLTGIIEYANPYFEVITGYTLEEVKGKNPRLLNSGLQSREFYEELWGTIRSGQSWYGHFINRRKDGSLYHEAATIFPIKNNRDQIVNYAAVKRDISAQIEAERIIQESERRYRLLADNVSDVIWTMNMEGRFNYVSPSVEALRGYTPEEVLQQTLEEALTPASAAAARRIFDEFLHNIQTDPYQPRTIYEFEQTCKNGGSVWTESLINAMYDDDGQVIGLLGVTRNIQARKQAEAEKAIVARKQELLNEITLAAIAQMDFHAMLKTLADRLGELLDADGCYITLWDEENLSVIPAAAYGPMRDTYPKQQSQAKSGEPTFTARLYETRRTLIVPDVFNSPYISRRLAEQYPTRSMLCLPLIADDRFLGGALISFHETHTFIEQEIQRGEQAARQVALAILKAQLLSVAERRATEAETLRQAGAAVASTLHQQEAIERILNELKCVVPYDSASVMLLRGNEFEVVGQNGFEYSILGVRFAAYENNPNAVVLQTRQAYLLDDAPAKYENFHSDLANHIHGWLGVPIIVNDIFIGMITLDSRQAGSFTNEHARLASAFADQVGIALENSRLFEETQRLAITDSLTGLFNRRHFMAMAEREYQRACRYQYALSVIMLDIDHFKQVNDTYGHLAGDQALQDLAGICNAQLRGSDTLGRYGGEELIIFLPETTLKIASKVGERLRQRVAEHTIKTDRASFTITISMGIAQLDQGCRRLEDLIDRADQALYQAKNTGRNRVIVWGDKLPGQA